MNSSRSIFCRLRSTPRFIAFAVVSTLAPFVSAVDRTGAEIYQEQCVRCHGPNGEGVADKHDEPLYGDRSLKSLARVIERTMPEDSDIKSTPAEAEKVATYIYEKFYSPAARSRSNPPRIELARLTARQYQNSVADLWASFTDRKELGPERGLNANYFSSRNFNQEKKAFERTDPRIQFDFGAGSPAAPGETNVIAPEEFSIRWTGSILAEETGVYEFRIKTQNGARLYVNDNRMALIDAWVSSGPEIREHKETIRLLGGRAYPFQVEFFKFKEKGASVVVEWKPPHKTWEVIPARCLNPTRVPEVAVVTTDFPADDGSTGYERGTIVSKEWDQATTQAAIDIAGKVVERLAQLSGAGDDAQDRREKVQKFCEKFVERAFRRPLDPSERDLYIARQFYDAKDLEGAVKRIVILTLKSPRFLYPELPGHLQADFLVASRLALTLWDSLPDRALLEAAEKGELLHAENIRAQASRMLQDNRTRAKIKEFFHHWLEMEEAEDLSKDPNAFPDFTAEIIADLRTSLELFIDDIVWSEKSDYRDLLRANHLFLNSRLAGFYGAILPESPEPGKTDKAPESEAGEGERLESENIHTVVAEASEALAGAKVEQDTQTFHKVEFDPAQRSGVITHPYLLAAFAYYKSSSPIHRGVFLTRNIIGRALKPPPMAIQFMDGRFDPGLTMREKVTELTSPAACMGCHSIINPLGFSLEHFDGVGRFRTMDNQKLVDAASDFLTGDGETIRLKGARDVADYAVNSEEAHRGFTRQLFQHLTKQPAGAFSPDTLEQLRDAFETSDFNIQRLVVRVVERTVLHGIEKPGPSTKDRASK